jgi:hypothetical protein
MPTLLPMQADDGSSGSPQSPLRIHTNMIPPSPLCPSLSPPLAPNKTKSNLKKAASKSSSTPKRRKKVPPAKASPELTLDSSEDKHFHFSSSSKWKLSSLAAFSSKWRTLLSERGRARKKMESQQHFIEQAAPSACLCSPNAEC